MDQEISDIFRKYLAGEATERESGRLVFYIKTNPQLHHWFEHQIQNSPSEINGELKRKMFDTIREQAHETPQPTKPIRIGFPKWGRVAAAILIPLVIAFGGYHFFANEKNETVESLVVTAEKGEKANISLPDGSRVWLNSGSQLVYYSDYNRKKRYLELNGEAYFEVIHNEAKEFIVCCNDMQIRVLGTIFNVKAYNEDSIVSTVLVEGKVKITTPETMQIMQPDQRVTYNRMEKKLYSETVEANDFTDWRKNRLRFENETFADIAKTIARIYNVDYVFEDESIKNLHFTGTVDNTNIESLLDMISIISPITYSLRDNLIVFKKNKK
jgi:ferric-dicitrate binding protein FerR (iron transport regulator)